MSAESRAYERSGPGTHAPVYLSTKTKDITNGWRRQTPPIVSSNTETYDEVIAKQGRSDNRSG